MSSDGQVVTTSDLKSALPLHHKMGNISDVYTSPAAMHDDLVAQQEIVSAHIELIISCPLEIK